MFVDQNIFWVVTPFKIPFIDATYGAFVDVPFAIADATGNASLQPVLTVAGFRSSNTLLGSPRDSGGGVTKGSIADLFLEPVDLGWHFKQLDAIVSGSVIIPSGPYNSHATVNIGSGNAAGLLGLGGIFYPDAARTWSLSVYSHYEMYASQMGRPYTLGDEAILEWSVGKTFDLPSEIFKRFTIGPSGYAQWQTTDNQIEITPINSIESGTIRRLEEAQLRVYSAGPALELLTKYGMFDLRYYDEFGANATPSGQQLMFSVTLAGNPWH
jgi:hypothetical protein